MVGVQVEHWYSEDWEGLAPGCLVAQWLGFMWSTGTVRIGRGWLLGAWWLSGWGSGGALVQ